MTTEDTTDRAAVGVGDELKAAYDAQYADGMAAWRELGGKHKALNIEDVCRGRRFGRVLDCGAGEGAVLAYLDRSGLARELYAVEISSSGLARIRERSLPRLVEAEAFDGYRIPYPDGHFDMAYCSHVIEHVEHPRLLLRELRRVSAHQVFEIPLDYAVGADARIDHFLAYGHIAIYTPSTFRFLLKSEGFEILAERLTHTAVETAAYNWYVNQGHERTLARELRLRVVFPLRRLARRALLGKRRYEEFGYAAYTCLARGVGEMKVFGSGG